MISIVHAAVYAAQKMQNDYPIANWFVIFGSVLVSWLTPLATLFALVWTLLQIYLAVEKRWGARIASFFRRKKR